MKSYLLYLASVLWIVPTCIVAWAVAVTVTSGMLFIPFFVVPIVPQLLPWFAKSFDKITWDGKPSLTGHIRSYRDTMVWLLKVTGGQAALNYASRYFEEAVRDELPSPREDQ